MKMLDKDSNVTIDKLFKLLDDWRGLPTYQLERRADIFFAIHLDKIMMAETGSVIDFIIPEFPVRKGHLPFHEKYNNTDSENYKPNQSFHIDYLCYSGGEQPKVYLVELKTDKTMRNDRQDWYLKNAAEIKVAWLVDGVIEIFYKTKQKKKYQYLLSKLKGLEWLKIVNNKFEAADIEIEPSVIYIQPTNDDDEDGVITYDDVIKKLFGIKDPLTVRFVESLEEWKTDVNK